MLKGYPIGGNDPGTVSTSIFSLVLERSALSGNYYSETVFHDVIRSSLALDNVEQFCAWTQDDLQRIFPHGMMACGIGDIENYGARVEQIVTCNFPDKYIQTMRQAGGTISSPIIEQWVKTREPVLYEVTERHANMTWLNNFKRYGLQNMAAHGLCDMRSRTTSYFTFSKIPGRLTPRHAELLEMLVPHLHVILIRALNGTKKESPTPKITLPRLTPKEHVILHWMGSGKSNWEIAQILHVSENTIKNHVQRILIKLKVNTRAQAVAQVTAQGSLQK